MTLPNTDPSRGKIKVAFFAEVLIKHFDGATRTMFQIIERVDRERYEYLFFCGMPPVQDIGFEVFHVPAWTVPFNKTYKMASVFGMGPRIKKRLERYKPDVIHISTPSPLGYYALKYAKAHNVPVVSIYHTHFLSYVKYYTKGTPILTQALEGALAYHNRSFYDRCDLVYVPTDEIIEELSEKDFDTSNMILWQRGINTELFNPAKRDKAYLRGLTGKEGLDVLFASRLVWEKNLETLIGIYDLLMQSDMNYNLIIAGEGVALEELEKRLPKAIFLGYIEHEMLSKVYASSDYFVFTSDTETYGNVVAEAMASGLPCICADGGGVRSIIQHGVNGFLCNVHDAADYIRMIDILQNHPSLRDAITSRARADAVRLDWDSLVATYFTDVARLAGKGRFQNDTEDIFLAKG